MGKQTCKFHYILLSTAAFILQQQLPSCYREHMAGKSKIFTIRPFAEQKKSMLTPDLNNI